jgi:hypothetical protein
MGSKTWSRRGVNANWSKFDERNAVIMNNDSPLG